MMLTNLLAFFSGLSEHLNLEGILEGTTVENEQLNNTFIDWGVMRDTDVRGSCDAAPPRQTEKQALALWLLDCALQARSC